MQRSTHRGVTTCTCMSSLGPQWPSSFCSASSSSSWSDTGVRSKAGSQQRQRLRTQACTGVQVLRPPPRRRPCGKHWMRPCMLLWPSTSPADSYPPLQGSGRLPAGTLEGPGAAPSQLAGRTRTRNSGDLVEVDCFQNFKDTADHTILEGYIGSPKSVRYQVATLVV